MLAPAMARTPQHGTRAAFALTVLLAGAALPIRRAEAQPTVAARPAEADVSAQAKAAAQLHFQKAQELYQQGSYREAIAELEAAVALDPRAKNLYFNLGVVDEKLGRIDEALDQFKKYATFDLEADERSRVEKYIRRLEGAKAQLALQPAPMFVAAPTGVLQPRPEEKIPNGRIDAATVTAASLSLLGFGFGTALALRASSVKPLAGYVTGRDGTYGDLEAKAKDAHKLAVFADVGFGVGIAAGITAVYLYFARPRTVARGARSTGSARVTGSPLRGGGQIIVGGSF